MTANCQLKSAHSKSLRLLVTGAAGFVGWKTCELLLEAGHTVVGLDNLNPYYDIRLKEWRRDQLLAYPNFSFKEVDIEDGAALRAIFEAAARATGAPPPGIEPAGSLFPRAASHEPAPGPGAPPPSAEAAKFPPELLPASDQPLPHPDDLPASTAAPGGGAPFDAVINLGARAGVRASIEEPEVYYTTNVLGSLRLLELVREYGVGKYVLASTSSLYAGHPLPFAEDAPVNRPISPYAASKKAAEAMAFTWHHLHGIDVSVVRYFTVYGPAGRPDMSPLRFLRWIDEGTPITLYGDGSQTRDFTYIDDIARGTIAALQKVGFEIINLGGGNRPVSIREMIDTFARALGKEARIEQHPFHAADMKDTAAVIDKAHTLLGWTPTVSPETGFQRTVDWYLQHRDLVRSLNL